MADYLVTDTELTSIANAIRTKGGTSGTLTFPTGFVSAINDIQTGITPTGTINITSNGSYNVESFEQADVLVPQLSLASLTVSENGTYTPSSGYAFGQVDVSVAGVSADPIHIIATTVVSGSISGSATSIVDYAFAYHALLGDVYFPSCTSVGGYAFYNCQSITKVSFPMCTTVGAYAFYWCYRISSASFPSCTTIGAYAFYSCNSLKTAYFPACTSMFSNAFASCRDLSYASFPVYSDTIPSYAFYQCKSLTGVSFPSTIGILSCAFYACTSLPSVEFSNCTFVGSNAFYGCSKLSTISFLQATAVNTSAFAQCSTLNSVYMPKLEIIHSWAFMACSNLSIISVPARIVSVGAFANCYSLNTIILSYSLNSAKNIYASAFRSCSKLFSLYLLYSSAYTLSNVNAFAGTPISVSSNGVYGSIFVPDSMYSSYLSSTTWKTFSARIVSLTESQIAHVLEYGTHVM